MIVTYDSPIGVLEIVTDGPFLTAIHFSKRSRTSTKQGAQVLGKVEKAAIKQLTEYFSGKRKTFDLPIRMSGTEFQLKTWNALQNIPYGATVSYGEQACAVGKKGAVRAIGSANGKNPLPIIVPCHRVVRSDGTLGGYAGGLAIKKALLALESGLHSSL